MRRIIVVGASHHNTLSVLRSLGEVYGLIELIILGSDSSYVANSIYVNSVKFLPNKDELYPWLKLNATSGKSIIISCSDDASQILDVHYGELRNHYDFFNAGENGRLTSYMDKQKQVELANASGFITPYSVCYEVGDDIPVFATFPCILKPLMSFVGGKSITQCDNYLELKDTLERLPVGVKFQVQQLVNKHYEIVLPGLVTRDQIVIPGYIQKHRDFMGGTTYSSVKRHTPETRQLVACIEIMLRRIGYSGLFGVEAIYDGENFYFIELNLRNDATCYSMSVAGVNLPALYVDYIERGQFNRNIVNYSEIQSIVENKDFSHVLRGKIGLLKWVKQLIGAECKYLYNKKDMKPLFFCLWDQLLNKLR